ncbi:methyl-accepting chemotaxis protein [Vibrio navarrensis]|uniref:methyl-accepting chemotaxis protein n=1 Tax=Vibrio navarrensis TaxID=29495 RepID=UPI0018DC55EF|nr:methyl-accepting chemotaxis protein [Vibrio navarrensis]MBH9738993.1 methyl-accepting chemotaxis protein [Vibrio navarrensis]
MNPPKTKRASLSLIQAISVLFLSIILLVFALSISSYNGVQKIGTQFSTLSTQALPLAMNNAKLTQNILEQIKLLNYGSSLKDPDELQTTRSKITQLTSETSQYIERVMAITSAFEHVISTQQQQQLQSNVDAIAQITSDILARQAQAIENQQKIDQAISTFRYGLSSIGPEMNRISSFLSVDNPESTDAANRFSAGASSMESTFLMLMMQSDPEKAESEYREMRNRIAGIRLAYDDFKEWHPDVTEFASLTAPYEMVLAGFKEQGVLAMLMERVQNQQEQQMQITQATHLSNETIELLNAISATASSLIHQGEQIVNQTISNMILTLTLSGVVVVALVITSWLGFRAWVNRGLKNILKRLSELTQHNFTQLAEEVGPREMREVARKLNQVINSTGESLTVVTRNCEALYQTAEISHGAAEYSSQSLSVQNDALAAMVATVTELEASIKEIASVTSASYDDAKTATENTRHGVRVVEGSLNRLALLEQSLNINEEAMRELDLRVKAIREMVDLISGIAENTNLLALNAAIEAARAGEQGRGFAVVADEVRKLASDTSKQTSNISEMMNELISAAEKSRQSVDESRKGMAEALAASSEVKVAFSDIEIAVGHIRERVEQITLSTEEQQRATSEVSRSIAHVSEQGDQTRQQLESMVESSQQVADIAGQQQEMLHKYQLAS